MQHERGDVPGPSTKPDPHTPTGEPASVPTSVPQPPLGYETGSPNPDPAKSPDPIPGKYQPPSEGETKRQVSGMDDRFGNGFMLFPGEDS